MDAFRLGKRRLISKQPPRAGHCIFLNGKWTFEIPLRTLLLDSAALPKDVVTLIMSFHGPVAWTPFVFSGRLMEEGPLMTCVALMNFASTLPGNASTETIAGARRIRWQVLKRCHDLASHLHGDEHRIPCFTAAAGYIMAACVFQLSLRERRELLVDSSLLKLRGMCEDGRNVWREMFHAMFCSAAFAAMRSQSKRGHDETVHLYDLLRTVCFRGHLRPFRFWWQHVSVIQSSSWGDAKKANALGWVVKAFYDMEGFAMHNDADPPGASYSDPCPYDFIDMLDEDGNLC